MYVDLDSVVGLVRTKSDAQKVIAELICRFSTDSAWSRLSGEATFAHQSMQEMALRTAGNVLDSLVVRKPGGCVE